MLIGVFGGAFNPPTRGHQDVIEQALPHFDRILLIPSFSHAFNKFMIDYRARCELLDAFIADMGHSQVMLDRIENELATCPSVGGEYPPIYTIDVMEALQAGHPNDQLKFICGPDNISNFHRFKGHQYILEKWSLFGVNEGKEIRSTLVRERLHRNECVSELLTPGVLEIIKKRKLYE